MSLFRIAALAILGVFFAQAAGRPSDLARLAFDAVNQARARHGLARLAWDDKVAALALSHSRRMRDLRFFAHEDPERGSIARRIRGTGIAWNALAENIYSEKGLGDPAGEAVNAWLDSPGHRRNMLGRPFTRTGVGVVTDGRGEYWFTQIFVGGGKR